MKRITLSKICLCLGAVMVSSLLPGCAHTETQPDSTGSTGTVAENTESTKKEYVNLDFTNAKITENTPESGTWKILSTSYPNVTPETFQAMQEAAAAYGGYTLHEDDVVCQVCIPESTGWGDIKVENDDSIADGGGNLWGDVRLHDMTDSLYASSPYMRYLGDDLYMDINAAGKLELYNRAAVREILGEDFGATSAWSWRLSFSGSEIKSYDIDAETDLTDTYRLNGTDVSIKDAMAYATEFLNTGKLNHICSKLFSYTPSEVTVYEFSDDQYGYLFEYQLNYDGVPLDASHSVGDSEDTEIDLFSSTIKVGMLTGSSLDWIWTCGFNTDVPESEETCEIRVDYDAACQAVSEKLSQEHVFTVESADLLYCTGSIIDENAKWNSDAVRMEPMWQFKLTNVGSQDYSILYINVNAMTGEVCTRTW